MRLLMLDTAMRLIGIGQLLLIAVVVARGTAPGAIRAATVLLLVGVTGYLANSAQLFRGAPVPVWALTALASNLAALFLWLFAHLLFERPVPRIIAAGALLGLTGLWLVFVFGRAHRDWLSLASAGQHLVSLLLAAHSVIIALAERADDLIETRRRFRVAFVLVVGVQALAVVVAESWFGFGRAPGGLMLIQSTIIVLAATGTGAALLQADSELLFDSNRARAMPVMSPAEHVLNKKLEEAMTDGIWREAGLTIGMLAERLGAPEHRLRALINRRLGYRNFSAFLNDRRIAEAKTLLADPAKVDLPVLTIAMDLGYGSLAPFNRAFREAAGQTPSDFRRAAILNPENC